MRYYEADRCFSVIRVDKERKLKVEKQESLPFPPTPMAGKASLSMQESVYEPARRRRVGFPRMLRTSSSC